MTIAEATELPPAHRMGNSEGQAPIRPPTTEPLEVAEPSVQDELGYLTGVKFAAVMIAMGLALILVGLDSHHHSQRHEPLQDYCGHRLVRVRLSISVKFAAIHVWQVLQLVFGQGCLLSRSHHL